MQKHICGEAKKSEKEKFQIFEILKKKLSSEILKKKIEIRDFGKKIGSDNLLARGIDLSLDNRPVAVLRHYCHASTTRLIAR